MSQMIFTVDLLYDSHEDKRHECVQNNLCLMLCHRSGNRLINEAGKTDSHTRAQQWGELSVHTTEPSSAVGVLVRRL